MAWASGSCMGSWVLAGVHGAALAQGICGAPPKAPPAHVSALPIFPPPCSSPRGAGAHPPHRPTCLGLREPDGVLVGCLPCPGGRFKGQGMALAVPTAGVQLATATPLPQARAQRAGQRASLAAGSDAEMLAFGSPGMLALGVPSTWAQGCKALPLPPPPWGGTSSRPTCASLLGSICTFIKQ